jgi:broad specificity phosphatase PhoE
MRALSKKLSSNTYDNTPLSIIMIHLPTTRTASVSKTGGFLPSVFESERSLPAVDDDQYPDGENSYGQIIAVEQQHQRQEHEVLLYLIRHGEAEHNIKEKVAMEEAKRKSVTEDGLAENDPVLLERVEEARKSVLNDESLRDAKLSQMGRHEAEQARGKLLSLMKEKHLPQPEYVLVSPLTRTLETCDIIFPEHDDIHVRDDLAERHTGKPPDTRSPVISLINRPSFFRFSMEKLRESVMSSDRLRQHQGYSRRCSLESTKTESFRKSQHRELSISKSQPEIFVMDGDLWERTEKPNHQFTEEDKQELRKRTERLFALLSDANAPSVAVVTHKG